VAKNPCAYPSTTTTEYGPADDRQTETIACVGMSLRDYFAGQVLAGLYAQTIALNTLDEDLAAWAYSQADAMLHHREEPYISFSEEGDATGRGSA
jgi:hypothetical protein